jgi:hypothetical protein
MPRAGFLVVAGVLAAVAGGVHVAASTAETMAGTFSTTQGELRARHVEAESSIRRASARLAKARVQCERFRGAKRELCDAAARADRRRGIRQGPPSLIEAP